jgi:hypothetical protein
MTTRKRSAAGYEQQKKYIRDWQRKNRARLAERSKQQRSALRMAALRQYGGEPPRCCCCRTAYVSHLTVAAMSDDVLVGTTGQTGTTLYRKLAKEKYPDGYRVLCWNCLMSRCLYNACPHETETGDPAHYLLHEARLEGRSSGSGSRNVVLADR